MKMITNTQAVDSMHTTCMQCNYLWHLVDMVCTYELPTKQTKLPYHNFKSYWSSVEHKYKYELNNDNIGMWLVSYIGLYMVNHIAFIMPI